MSLLKSPLHIVLLGSTLAFSVMTQLRVGNLVGPAEALMLLSFGLALAQIVKTGRSKTGRISKLYLSLAVYLVIVGNFAVLLAEFRGTIYPEWWRQLSFIFFPMILPVLYSVAYGPRVIESVLQLFAVLAVTISAVPFLLTLVGITMLGPIDFMYSTRFTGWARNPNQTALVIGLAVPMLYTMLTKGQIARGRGLVLIGLGVWIGIATRSDALLLCWIVVIGLLLAPQRSQFKSRILRLLASFAKTVVSVTAFGVSMLWIFNNADDLYYGTGTGMGENQGAVRVTLWMNAYRAFLEAPLIGHGHGHFSGLGAPFLGSEAHNLYFDWLASYGLLGSILLAMLLIAIGLGLLKQRKMLLFSMLTLILTLSVFHFYGRHPLFWTFLFYLAAETFRIRRPTAMGMRSMAVRT